MAITVSSKAVNLTVFIKSFWWKSYKPIMCLNIIFNESWQIDIYFTVSESLEVVYPAGGSVGLGLPARFLDVLVRKGCRGSGGAGLPVAQKESSSRRGQALGSPSRWGSSNIKGVTFWLPCLHIIVWHLKFQLWTEQNDFFKLRYYWHITIYV